MARTSPKHYWTYVYVLVIRFCFAFGSSLWNVIRWQTWWCDIVVQVSHSFHSNSHFLLCVVHVNFSEQWTIKTTPTKWDFDCFADKSDQDKSRTNPMSSGNNVFLVFWILNLTKYRNYISPCQFIRCFMQSKNTVVYE